MTAMTPPPREVELPEGWLAHDGGPCPVPLDSYPEVRWNNGAISKWCTARTWSAEGARDGRDFWRGEPGNRIIAYKPDLALAKPETTP